MIRSTPFPRPYSTCPPPAPVDSRFLVYANCGGRRLLLGEPSANTPYPLARTFAPPPHFPPQHAGIPPSPNNHPPNHFFNHPTTTPTITQLRLNHPSCRIQERFRHNHPSFVQSPLQAKFSLIRGRRTSPTATQPLLNHNAAKVPRFIVLSSLSAFQPKRRGRFAAIFLENREG